MEAKQSTVLRERIWLMLQVPVSKSIARQRRVLLSGTTIAPYPHGHAGKDLPSFPWDFVDASCGAR